MECDACHKPFDKGDRRPKCLPCAHTFCLTCMRCYGYKMCPRCRKRFREAPDLLPDNSKLQEAHDLILKHSSADSKVSVSGISALDTKVQIPAQTLGDPLVQICTQTSPLSSAQAFAQTSPLSTMQSFTQTTPQRAPEPAADDKKDVKCVTRFWCLDCEREAEEECVEAHSLCNMRLLWARRLKQAQAELDALSQSEDSLAKLRAWMEAASRNVEEELADLGFVVEKEMAELQEKRTRLEEAAQSGDTIMWEEVKSSSKVSCGFSTDVSQLMTDLAGDKSKCSLALEDDGVQWVATVPAAEEPLARLLLCRLMRNGGLKQRQQPGERSSEAGSSVTKQCELSGDLKGSDKMDTQEVEEPDVDGLNWEEQSNTAGQLSVEEMAGRVRVGSKVRRGRDWDWQGQGRSEAGHGTVTKVEAGRVTVRWQKSGQSGTYNMGAGGKFCLKLLSSHLVNGWSFVHQQHINLLELSTSNNIKMKTNLLMNGDLKEVRTVLTLCCNVSPGWAVQVLRQVSDGVENLVVHAPEQQHLEVIRSMPKLRKLVLLRAGHLSSALPAGLQELYLQSVGRDQLAEISTMAALQRLEVRCPFSDPIVGLDFPRAAPPAGLRWLRCGLYPLRTALNLMRAHRDTLEEVELEASSRAPYGCPDLATELRRCRLQRLRRLVLLRETGRDFCWHDLDTCSKQKFQVWDTLLNAGTIAVVECSLCDSMTCE